MPDSLFMADYWPLTAMRTRDQDAAASTRTPARFRAGVRTIRHAGVPLLQPRYRWITGTQHDGSSIVGRACAPLGQTGRVECPGPPGQPRVRPGGDRIGRESSCASLAPLGDPIPVTKTYQNLIGADWKAAGSGATFTSVSPANLEDVIGEFAASGPADVDAAVAAARRAFPAWSGMPAPKRGEILLRIARLLAEHKEA